MIIDNEDIKIVGDKPSLDVKKNQQKSVEIAAVDKELSKKAKKVGETIANDFINDVTSQTESDIDNTEMMLQRKLLLSFTATVGFEQHIKSDVLIGIAQKSFLDTIKEKSEDLYKSASDTGAFSFYYLAYRRGDDIERRIGQTFAMLCSHDGDPIFQELGEALFCWFSSRVRAAVKEYLS